MSRKGKLYVVGTPIGNLKDFSLRALEVLNEVDLIAAEDTRHSRKLLVSYGISTPVTSYHHHNQAKVVPKLLDRLLKGLSIALICDAGTPAISDPGASLVSGAHQFKVSVIPIPGASALTCALSACGLNYKELLFLGFLPSKKADRRKKLEQISTESRCLVFFEAPHRIVDSLKDMVELLGSERRAFIARQMTKIHETIRQDTLGEIYNLMVEKPGQAKGEIVVIVNYLEEKEIDLNPEVDRVLSILLEELSPGTAARLAAKILTQRRNAIYKRALELKES